LGASLTQDLPALKANWGIDLTSGYRERAFRLSEIETKKVETMFQVFVEGKPRPDVIVRAEFQNLGARDVDRVREVWAGPRATTAQLYTDSRNLQFGRALFIRVRKIF
jgi:hypothetical protein